MLAGDYLVTPIARIATRGGGAKGMAGITDTDNTPDAFIGTLMRSEAHLLRSNYIYELVLNEITGVIELREKGQSIIGKQWGRELQDIILEGPRTWLTVEETEELRLQEGN